jgi:hypothetical protein
MPADPRTTVHQAMEVRRRDELEWEATAGRSTNDRFNLKERRELTAERSDR